MHEGISKEDLQNNGEAMTKKEANKKAKELYGPQSNAVAVSNVKDRHQRFGIAYLDAKGMTDSRTLYVLGYGDSYESAFDMASKNPVAEQAAKLWSELKEDFKKFGNDPWKYIEEEKKKLQENLENAKRTASEGEQSIGSSGEERAKDEREG